MNIDKNTLANNETESMDRIIRHFRWKQFKLWVKIHFKDFLQIIIVIVIMNLFSIDHAILFLLVIIFARQNLGGWEIYGTNRDNGD